ncbi:MAG: archease [Ignavibacteria bacterium]|nr:archease [Ignavibacteria bacterium]MBI3764873.1 archease [Ignavibacteriales bacterium]
MQASYTILDHPADLGIEARGATLAEAFQNAARALTSIILDVSTVEPREPREIIVTAADVEQLLVKWLSEILYLYDGGKFVGKEFVVTALTTRSLHATIHGENFSKSKHRTQLDVKAVTYHQLEVHEDKSGVVVRVYLDI